MKSAEPRDADTEQVTARVKWGGTRVHRSIRSWLADAEVLAARHLGLIVQRSVGPRIDRRSEDLDELGLRVGATVDLGQGPELGVGTEDEIDTGAGPLQLTRAYLNDVLERLSLFPGHCALEERG